MRTKKRIIICLTVLIVALVGYTALGPFITVYRLKSAARAHDGAAMAAQIDFPALRGHFKQQIDAALIKKTGALQSNKLFGLFAAGVASSLGDRIVNLLVTPSGLEALMSGIYPKALLTRAVAPQEKETSAPTQLEPFREVRYTYDSLSAFSVWVKNDTGGETRFVLTRTGIGWKLSNIVLSL